MATKKKTTDVVEEVKEAAVEETPKTTKKTTTKKSTAKKVKEPVAKEPTPEEVVVEEPKVEEPVVAEPVIEEPVAEEPIVEEPIEEPKVEEPKVKVKADIGESSDFTAYMGLAKGILQVRKDPNMQSPVINNIPAGSKFTILEIDGNWARIGKNRWVNINYIKKV